MSNRKKGFDPLSSLFDAPGDSPIGATHEDPYGSTEPGRRIRVSDSLVGEAVDAGLDLEDAPTEMAPIPAALPTPANLAVSGDESEDGVEFIDELPAALPASDDWTESKPEALYSLNQLPKPDPNEEAAPRYGRRMSRVQRLAARAVRPMSALEAARSAARQETEEEPIAAADEAPSLADRIQVLIPACLPGVGAMHVANAKVMPDRTVLQAIWKSHRTKFLGDGELERAVAAARVLHAFADVPSDSLVAAHVVTDASDYLVWIDLQSGSLVAAFADARAYFAG
jgi:hypothetical protein